MTLRFEVNTLQHYARLLGNKFMKEKKIITYTWFHRYFHRKYFTIYLVTDLSLFNVSLKNDIHFLLLYFNQFKWKVSHWNWSGNLQSYGIFLWTDWYDFPTLSTCTTSVHLFKWDHDPDTTGAEKIQPASF